MYFFNFNLFAQVTSVGQILGAIVAASPAEARKAAATVIIKYREEKEPILTIEVGTSLTLC